MGEIAPRGKTNKANDLEKEIERLKSEAKKDFSRQFSKYIQLAKENDKLIEKLAVKEKAHEIAVNCWMKAEKDLTKEKLRVEALEGSVKRFYCENGGNECITQCYDCKKDEDRI